MPLSPSIRHVSLADPVMGEWIRDVGACKGIVRQRRSPFETQLHGSFMVLWRAAERASRTKA